MSVSESKLHSGAPAGQLRLAERPLQATVLSCLLAVSSLTFLFAVGFPWQHHNESLVWDIDLRSLSFWNSLLPHPVTHVSSYRPFGIALAWLTLKVSDGGLWLQQLINYVLTVLAWWLTLASVRDRLSFAWVSFICGGVFFPGYIYLFHLHGVFYGPLLLFLAWLLIEDQQGRPLRGPNMALLLSIATVAALFHTFAYLLLAAYLCGRGVEDWIQPRATSLVAVAAGVVACGIGILLLMYSSQSVGTDYALAGLLTSYRALEVSPLAGFVAAPLAVWACISIAHGRIRVACITGVVIASVAMAALHLPVLLAWIGICCVKPLLERRLGLAALVAISAVLPAATGTGSPTYALVVLLPVCKVTLDGFEARGVLYTAERGLAIAAVVVVLLVYVTALSGAVPTLNRAVGPLLAEKQKTDQMMAMFAWLDANPDIKGNLRLCQAADYPVHSGAARERRYRAPTDAFSFNYYLKARYGERLVQPGPQLLLCFGGQEAGGATLHAIAGSWAGAASLQRH